MIYRVNYLPPLLVSLCLLNACATPKPVLQPVAAPCQKFQVDKELLVPAEDQADKTLQAFAPQLTPKISATPSGSTN